MAGHSKFANIQHRKGGQDKKRAQAFTKIAREIQAAVKLGGPDPNANPRLFRAMAAGRAINMTKDNIQRAIDKGGGAVGGQHAEGDRHQGVEAVGLAGEAEDRQALEQGVGEWYAGVDGVDRRR